MKIIIEVIPHDQQRYDTCGDWQFIKHQLHIKVSGLGDWRQEALIAVHELIEALICKHRNITTKMVDEFDTNYEAVRKPGDESEPGDDPLAPYYEEHQFATCIERLLCLELGVNWQEYDKSINAL